MSRRLAHDRRRSDTRLVRWLIKRRPVDKRGLPPWVRGLIGFAVLFSLLEAFTRAEVVDPRFLPPASVVLLRVVQLLSDPEFLGHVLATLQAWAAGLVLAIVVAVPAGVVLGSFNMAYAASRAIVEFLRPIPSVSLIPLAILLFGQGTVMKVSLIVYACTWPILFNTIYGMHDVDPVAKDSARSFGFGTVSILARISLPSAAPFIYTGIRIAAAVALIVAFSAEFIAGGRSGLGTWMLAARSGLRPDLTLAGVVVAGIMGWAINWSMVELERRVFGWQPALREGS